MSATATKALHVLNYNRMHLERILLELSARPSYVLVDEDGDEWTFTTRRRCRLFLMAKTRHMKQYEEVYATSK